MNNEQRKSLLAADAEMYETILQAEANSTKEIVKKGIIIAGIITAGYTISRLLSGRNQEKEEKQQQSKSSEIGKIALGILTPIVLKFAQEKLSNLFAETTEDEKKAT